MTVMPAKKSDILLATRTLYAQCLPSFWSHAQDELGDRDACEKVCHPIGHTYSIFSVSAILLVTHTQDELGDRDACEGVCEDALRRGNSVIVDRSGLLKFRCIRSVFII